MKIFAAASLAALAALGTAAFAQTNPISTDLKADYATVKNYFIRSAEKMPDAAYTFKPMPDVRTFAQLVAHVADDQYNLCAPVKGEVRHAAYSEIEHTLTTKTELLAALKKAFAYCDAAYDSLTDASATDIVKFNNQNKTRFQMLNWNLWHTWEHYGNAVVYLRLNGLLPPSSEKKP
jgi:uncharacterized damage-inducible protein DinB